MKNTFVLQPFGDREIIIARSFAAPIANVFATWTVPALVQRWLLGPDGWTMPICEIDLRVDGKIRYVWRHTDGREFGLTGVFREVDAPRCLVHTELFDENWTGGETLVTTAFNETNGLTTVRSTVAYASAQARDGALQSGMEKGVAASYDRLERQLAGAPDTPRIVDVEAALAAVVRATVPFADMPAAQRAARAKLATIAAHPDIQPLGTRLTIWRPPSDGRIDYAPGHLIPRRFDPPAGIEIMDLPKGRAVHLHLSGPYAELPDAWSRLFTACQARGWKPAGLAWEVYAKEGPDGGETDLYALLS